VTALQYAINMQLGLDKTLGGPSLYGKAVCDVAPLVADAKDDVAMSWTDRQRFSLCVAVPHGYGFAT
jgi:hypothetical protein